MDKEYIKEAKELIEEANKIAYSPLEVKWGGRVWQMICRRGVYNFVDISEDYRGKDLSHTSGISGWSDSAKRCICITLKDSRGFVVYAGDKKVTLDNYTKISYNVLNINS